MSSRTLTVTLLIAIFLCISSSAFGQVEVQHAEANDPCPTYEACSLYIRSFIYTNTAGQGYYGLVPYECKQSSCRTCQADSPYRCVSVALEANCQCDDLPVYGAGAGITQCGNMRGTCVVR